jgi:hypothetical protein
MSRPDPIQYAERLYAAIREANFSPISFLAFGNAVKEGIALRNMPRMAAEPFMRVVGEMLDLEEDSSAEADLIDAETVEKVLAPGAPLPAAAPPRPSASQEAIVMEVVEASSGSAAATERASTDGKPRDGA